MVDWAKELDRYEHRCRVFRDEEESGSVTLSLSFMDGRTPGEVLNHGQGLSSDESVSKGR